MDRLQERALEILSELGRRPAAPFHEDGPAAYIVKALTDIGLSPRRDEFGNVIAHYRGPGADDTPIAFVAHMDHPGFEIVEASEGGLVAVALGGVPESSLTTPGGCADTSPGRQQGPCEDRAARGGRREKGADFDGSGH